jgi:monofunctional biosynthetic peptidoglycan transglycosylase
MAKARKSRKAKKGFWGRLLGWLSDEVRQLLRWVWRGLLGLAVLVVLWIAVYSVITPPTTLYIQQEKSRLGSVKREWVPMDQIAPAMQRSVVAAEDANFCAHWGFDVKATWQSLTKVSLVSGRLRSITLALVLRN